jgi:hypothetical protein
MSVPYDGQSTDTGVPGVSGTNTAASGVGVHGQSTTPSEPGTGGIGVRGDSNAVGVWGEGKNWHGVAGVSHSTIGGAGVFGSSEVGPGIIGESKVWHAIFSSSQSTTGGAGLWAENQASGTAGGPGVVGVSKTWHGTFGSSESTVGGAGVWGEHKGQGAGVVGQSASGTGVFGKGNPAGFFEGNITVTGDITLTGADCAEEFDVLEAVDVEPGTVMVLDQEGALQPSQQAYDKRVAGVISGAGDYKPGIVLDKQQSSRNRMPVALVGKVHCKVDAQYASIEVGDLLTTSDTPGHAMKADDPFKAFGSVIGKALRPLQAGQGLIPILIALQ